MKLKLFFHSVNTQEYKRNLDDIQFKLSLLKYSFSQDDAVLNYIFNVILFHRMMQLELSFT